MGCECGMDLKQDTQPLQILNVENFLIRNIFWLCILPRDFFARVVPFCTSSGIKVVAKEPHDLWH